MFDMSSPTCLGAEKGAWHLLWSDLGVFEPDFDETDKSLRWGEGRLKLTLCTEAGNLVFDMGG